MIAEKIGNVVRRLDKLEYLVSPEAWKVIGMAMSELIDAAESVKGFESHRSLQPAGLTVIDLVTVSDVRGKPKVDVGRLGELMGDLAEALNDVAGYQANGGGRPGPVLVPTPGAGGTQ